MMERILRKILGNMNVLSSVIFSLLTHLTTRLIAMSSEWIVKPMSYLKIKNIWKKPHKY